jgi:hypothetical protein
MSESDQVVVQDAYALSPPFTNQRVPEYERYILQADFAAARVGEDVTVYSRSCRAY